MAEIMKIVKEDDSAKIELEFMVNLLRDAFWDIHYEEGCLRIVHTEIAVAKALAARCAVDVSKITADDSDDESSSNIEEFVCRAVAAALSSIEYHEERLKRSHKQLATVKIIIMRRDLKINLEEIRADTIRRHDENLGKNWRK